MPSKTLACIVAAASLCASTLSLAQGYDYRGRGPAPHAAAPWYGPTPHARDPHVRGYAPHGWHRDARGPQLRRGGYLPYTYRQPAYVVRDWRAYHLHAPARGQQWVRVGTDFVLVAAATGLIASLVLSH